MLKRIKPNLLIVFVFFLLLAACTRGTQARPDEGVPAEDPPEEEVVELPSLEGEYTFSMNADFSTDKGIGFIKTTWKGDITIGSNGQIEGKGTYRIDEGKFVLTVNLCEWDFTAEGNFEISGMVLPNTDTIPIKILSYTDTGGVSGEPTKTCYDKGLVPLFEAMTPSEWERGTREAFLDAIILQVAIISCHLKVNEPLVFQKAKVGGADYNILVSTSEIPLEPLVPDSEIPLEPLVPDSEIPLEPLVETPLPPC